MIVAGEYSLSTFEGTEQIFRPSRMVVHPDYSSTSKNADIMLIKVTSFRQAMKGRTAVGEGGGHYRLFWLFTAKYMCSDEHAFRH